MRSGCETDRAMGDATNGRAQPADRVWQGVDPPGAPDHRDDQLPLDGNTAGEHDRGAGRDRRWWPRLTLAVLIVCLAAVGVMHLRGGLTSAGVILAAGLPAILLVGVLAASLTLRHRPVLRLILVAALLGSQAPLLDYLRADGEPAEGAVTLRVAALNTFGGGPSDAQLADLGVDADVVALSELDTTRIAGITRALGDEWRLAAQDHDPYIHAETAVWVRQRSWQVAEVRSVVGAFPPTTVVTLQRDGAEVRVVGTRLENPAFDAAGLWGQGMSALSAEAARTDTPLDRKSVV